MTSLSSRRVVRHECNTHARTCVPASCIHRPFCLSRLLSGASGWAPLVVRPGQSATGSRRASAASLLSSLAAVLGATRPSLLLLVFNSRAAGSLLLLLRVANGL
uniref:Uncharacterized protein n=1 Tax=Plectus sambesii TaxID=2011161 RepID=A0A914WNT0_9BILA